MLIVSFESILKYKIHRIILLSEFEFTPRTFLSLIGGGFVI